MIRPAEEGFERLTPPRRGEWRSLFHEEEQTVDEYMAQSAPLETNRCAFVLQPMGEVGRRHLALLNRMREYAEAFFGMTTRLARPQGLASPAFVPQRRQYNSSMLLDDLASRTPPDAAVYLALTDQDLFARGKKFVFGEGNPELRSGICSLSRLETSDASRFFRRAFRLMAHEAGHILRLAHCVTYRCVMQGSNSLEESDGQPLHLCPEDLRKLAWMTGVDRGERYQNLQRFFLKIGWPVEAAWAASRRQKRSVLKTTGEG